MYVLIHLGNINNSEREYRGREKKCVGNIRKGDNIKTPTLGNELGVMEGEEGRGPCEWVMGTEGGTRRDEHWVLF